MVQKPRREGQDAPLRLHDERERSMYLRYDSTTEGQAEGGKGPPPSGCIVMFLHYYDTPAHDYNGPFHFGLGLARINFYT